ncbi:hypothetical protein K402DRAFT_463941 [Aulographum hederae CBS 113979]|uniref:Uncharacterized protein n=1 Tax=Aulographum hederae CBS 113979 TaxID=1176131 RepID=A0A6G1GY98_9PEZI|nr:hypothetical protein K402DRAFT_463941 [Aulographum hederae CBS 113979]
MNPTNNPLTELDPNAQMDNTNGSGKTQMGEKAMGMGSGLEAQKKMLEGKVGEGAQQPYISPSDNILSPATQKLAAFRGRNLGKGAKPQSLFAKTTSKNANNASPAGPKGLFGDVKKSVSPPLGTEVQQKGENEK